MTPATRSLVTPVLGFAALALFALNFHRYIDHQMQPNSPAFIEMPPHAPSVYSFRRVPGPTSPSFRFQPLLPPPPSFDFRFRQESKPDYQFYEQKHTDQYLLLAEPVPSTASAAASAGTM
jgi:hypothetical protein